MIPSAIPDQRQISSEQRQLVLDEAMSWLRTPYHHQAAMKGVAADCAMFPLAVYRQCGLIPNEYRAPAYSSQWHLHRSEELYLMEIEKVAVEKNLAEIQPADFVIFKFGRTFSHGAIALKWPLVIHSYIPHGVMLADASMDAQLIHRPLKVFAVGCCR